jgi:hypothetical protein
MLRSGLLTAALVASSLAGGCGQAPPQIVEAGGVVLLDGAPLPKARVRFVPRNDYGPTYLAVAVTDDKGRFTLTCHGQSGACVGENLVSVGEAEVPEELTLTSAREKLQAYLKALKNRPIPAKYGNLAQSPLTMTVKAEQKEYVVELRR